jgi:very-short-patch-repair endonuclease
MERINNQKPSLFLRRSLRKQQTPQEVILWSRLRRKQLEYKFRRQHSVGLYILDFYCSSKKLAIEIDGSQHFETEAQDYDEKRTQYLNDKGIQVLRFTNADINTNIDGVLMKIMEVTSNLP